MEVKLAAGASLAGPRGILEALKSGCDPRTPCSLQLQSLDASISGGLVGYVRRAAALLKDSQEGKNPLEGFTPAVPFGQELQLGGPDFLEYEATGAAARCGFVVVAGGLGERLGYSGIKLELPPETLTGLSLIHI